MEEQGLGLETRDDKEAQTREEQGTPVELDQTQESVLERIETPVDERDKQETSITKPEMTMKDGMVEKDQERELNPQMQTTTDNPLTIRNDSEEETGGTADMKETTKEDDEDEGKRTLINLIQEQTFSPQMLTLVEDTLLETIHEGDLQVKIEVVRTVEGKSTGKPTLRRTLARMGGMVIIYGIPEVTEVPPKEEEDKTNSPNGTKSMNTEISTPKNDKTRTGGGNLRIQTPSNGPGRQRQLPNKPLQQMVFTLLPWCIVGKSGISSVLVRMTHALKAQAGGRREWLYIQMARSLWDLIQDEDIYTVAILGQTSLFENSPWNGYPINWKEGPHSAMDLSLDTWIILIAIYGAKKVNEGPNRMALHPHLISSYRWKLCVGLLSWKVIASFSVTPEQHKVREARYQTVQHEMASQIYNASQGSQGQMQQPWLTQLTHLSDPLVNRMLRNLDMGGLEFAQGQLQQEREDYIYRQDPAVFDTVAYACGRQYRPDARFALDQKPYPTQAPVTVPWEWKYPFDTPIEYRSCEETGHMYYRTDPLRE